MDLYCLDDACVCNGGTKKDHCMFCRKCFFLFEALNEDGQSFDPHCDKDKFCSLDCINRRHRNQAIQQGISEGVIVRLSSYRKR